ncbi:hypothetical protein HY407_02510 [Candidatus Gottesmanbacteria bacterium]|nr:hypothetical protein [Candidatus Gottesmanbacteria bacterium]
MQSQTENSQQNNLGNNQGTVTSGQPNVSSVPNVTPVSSEATSNLLPPKGDKHGLSFFFYIILGLTLFVFLGLIFAIYVTITAKNTLKLGESEKNLSEQMDVVSSVSPTVVSDAATEELSKQGSSDEVEDIEKDLNKTELNSLDEESSSIEVMLSP